MLRYYLKHTGVSAVEIVDSVQVDPEHRFSAAAAVAESSAANVTVDDPDGAYDILGLQRFYAIEDAIGSTAHVWDGFVGDQDISRGEGSSTLFPDDYGRRWALDLDELSDIFNHRIITGASGNRVAETAGVRLAWLLASGYLALADNGLVIYPSTAMDAVDYRGQTAHDVVSDICLQTSSIAWAYHDDGGDDSLGLIDPNGTTYSSDIRISWDPDDDDSDTFAPATDWVVHRSATNVSTGVYVSYSGGARYRDGITTPVAVVTAATFGAYRDHSSPTANIKTAAKADAAGDLMLAQTDEQDETVSCQITIPRARLNDLRHGQRMQVKLPAPGWELFRWARIVRKTPHFPENRAQTHYEVDLELSSKSHVYVSRGLGVDGGPDNPLHGGIGGGAAPCYSTAIDYSGGPTTLTVSSDASERRQDGAGRVTVPGGFGLRVLSWRFTPPALCSIRGILECIDTVSLVQKVVGSDASPFDLQSSGGGPYSMPDAFSGTYAYNGAYAPGSAGNNPSDASTSVAISGLSGDLWRNVTCTPQTIYLRGENNPESGASGTWTITCTVAVVP